MATEATPIQDPPISRKRQFAKNAASGFVAQAVAVCVGFITLPYLIWRLGPEMYGISQLAQAALEFFIFLQLGMGPTLIRYCSQAIAKNDREAICKVSSTAQLILGILGAILGIVFGLGLSFLFTKFALNPDGTPVVALYISYPFIALSGAIAVVASVAAAMIPAIKSSKLNPIDIIRNN